MKNNDTKKILGGLVGVPVAVISASIALYMFFWGVARVFHMVEDLVKGSILPWLQANWWICLLIWGGLVLASLVYSYRKNYRALYKELMARDEEEYDEDEDDEEEEDETDNRPAGRQVRFQNVSNSRRYGS